MSGPEKRLRGESNPKPDTTELDNLQNAILAGRGANHGAFSVQYVRRIFGFLEGRREKKRMAARVAEHRAKRDSGGTSQPG